MLEKSRHKAYTKSLLCSGDEKKIEAAVEAMERTLDKYFDSFQTEMAMKERQANRAAIKRLFARMAKLQQNIPALGDAEIKYRSVSQ